MKATCFLSIACSSLLVPSLLHAGAWGQEKGHGFLSVQQYYYATDHYYDHNGNVRERGGHFRKVETNPYIEYGVTDQDTLVLNLFYDWLSDDATGTTRTTSGLADIELGWQHQLPLGNTWVSALQVLAILPTGYDIRDDPRLGYDRFGTEFSFLAGKPFTFRKRYGFVDLRCGIRGYFGYPSTQLRSMATSGYFIADKWQILGSAELQYGLRDGSQKDLGNNLLVAPDYRLLKLSLALRYVINEQCSLVGTGYRHSWGEDTGKGGGAYVSFWYIF